MSDADACEESNSETLIDQFDSQMSFWLLIGIGFAKAIENALELFATEFMDVYLLGTDVSVIVAYLFLAFFGMLGLIYWETLKNK